MTDNTTGPNGIVGIRETIDGALNCVQHGSEIDDCVWDYIRGNNDAPLEDNSIIVPMFKEIRLPARWNGAAVVPWHVGLTLSGSFDSQGARRAHFKTEGGSWPTPLCIVGRHDGRYVLRTLIIDNLRDLTADGLPACPDTFHDGRYDHEITTHANMARTRWFDAWHRVYGGACYRCLNRSHIDTLNRSHIDTLAGLRS